ncbi:MAG: signal peptidase I [Lachnospiraceae bacterium]|nr:signal peptidase I [Lachnospiraceae bacterium]
MKKYFIKRKTPFTITIIILVTWYISSNWLQFALIQGDSMLPTYHNMQLVLVDKYSNEFHYNDVIIFTNEKLNATLIKRIIAIPGDTVQIIDGIVYVNNIPSPFLTQDRLISYSGIASSPLHLSSDEYFVLGDNYEKSKDSRYPEIGCINSDVILGKVYTKSLYKK